MPGCGESGKKRGYVPSLSLFCLPSRLLLVPNISGTGLEASGWVSGATPFRLVRLLGHMAGQQTDLEAGSKWRGTSTAPEVTVNSLSLSVASEFSSAFLLIFPVTPHNGPQFRFLSPGGSRLRGVKRCPGSHTVGRVWIRTRFCPTPGFLSFP